MVDEQTLIEQLCRFARLCYDRGLVGATGGNLSVRSREGLIIITPSGIALRDVIPDCLIKVDSRGDKAFGPERRK